MLSSPVFLQYFLDNASELWLQGLMLPTVLHMTLKMIDTLKLLIDIEKW